jgi:hypothetical protein
MELYRKNLIEQPLTNYTIVVQAGRQDPCFTDCEPPRDKS